jgi:hypothetical protein
MLSRQAWHLVQFPDSLCAQILRAKYYPNGDVLEAKAEQGISYTWRGILHGIDLLKQGVIWRIGDGTQVRIWDDPWIPKLWCRKVATPRNGLLTKVSELISPITGNWDVQLVKDTFWPGDVDMILNIPLREGAVDFRAWHFDPKGVHAVKQAYKLHRNIVRRDGARQGESSSSIPESMGGNGDQRWLHLWQLPCPNKLRMFAWRLAHNSLAVRSNLIRRGMVWKILNAWSVRG